MSDQEPKINEQFGMLADEGSIQKAAKALEVNGIEVIIAESGEDAKGKVFEMIPEGAEVMNMASRTLDSIGISEEITDSGKYKAVKNILAEMDEETQSDEMKSLGSTPEYAVGSVHAVTKKGEVLIASATGSQLPAYAYGAKKVIWVVGAQKIVENFNQGIRRIVEYVFPLEDVRAMKEYGRHSGINKVLIIREEVQPNRITMIIVKEKLGF